MKKLKLLKDNKFRPEIFKELLEGKITAYHVGNFLDNKVCHKVLSNFDASPGVCVEKVEPPIMKIGFSLYETANHKVYFNQASNFQSQIEKVFGGLDNPMNKILTDLKQYFEANHFGEIKRLQYDNKNACYGILRKWVGRNRRGLSACIHEDLLIPQDDYKNSIKEMASMNQMFSVVVCYNNDDTGGITRIYNKAPKLEDYKKTEMRESYGFKEDFVSETECLDVSLKQGDLLIFCSNLLHSVTAVKDNPRLTQQCFVGVAKSGNYWDLRYWS